MGGAALLCVGACQPGAGRGSFVQHAGQDTAAQTSLWIWPMTGEWAPHPQG